MYQCYYYNQCIPYQLMWWLHQVPNIKGINYIVLADHDVHYAQTLYIENPIVIFWTPIFFCLRRSFCINAMRTEHLPSPSASSLRSIAN